MPLAGTTKINELTCDEFKQLVEQIVDTALARRSSDSSLSEYIGSKRCAELLGITPEYLCAMRARGEGPPWSGNGRWVRYERNAVLQWLARLPQISHRSQPTGSDDSSKRPLLERDVEQARPP